MCNISPNTMRTAVAALISVFMCALLNAQGAVHPILESEVYTIEQSALRHSAAVAFSIGYPKGWTKSENTTVVSDNLGDLASVRDHELGSKGHIRISIDSMGTFLGMHESLQNLVLESLRFPQDHQAKAANAATRLLCSRSDRRGVAGRVGWARPFE